jgi:Protein of unknown function (DUF3485)
MKFEYSSLPPLKRLFLILSLGMAIAVTTGAVCGHFSQRWGPASDLAAAAEHLKTFPKQIGTWQLVKEDRMSDTIQQTLLCAGYVNRTYVDQTNGDEVFLAVIVGPTGPTSVHTPEICYSSQAYSAPDPRESRKLTDRAGKTHTFWRTVFRSPNATAEQLCVYYAWCADRQWLASESPRFEFGGRSMLYKLQLASLVPPANINQRNACEAFLHDLLNSGWNVSGEGGSG